MEILKDKINHKWKILYYLFEIKNCKYLFRTERTKLITTYFTYYLPFIVVYTQQEWFRLRRVSRQPSYQSLLYKIALPIFLVLLWESKSISTAGSIVKITARRNEDLCIKDPSAWFLWKFYRREMKFLLRSKYNYTCKNISIRINHYRRWIPCFPLIQFTSDIIENEHLNSLDRRLLKL